MLAPALQERDEMVCCYLCLSMQYVQSCAVQCCTMLSLCFAKLLHVAGRLLDALRVAGMSAEPLNVDLLHVRITLLLVTAIHYLIQLPA